MFNDYAYVLFIGKKLPILIVIQFDPNVILVYNK